MLLMACRGEITPKPDLVIFADVGWEPRPVYRHLEWLKTYVKKYGIEVVVESGGNIRNDIVAAVEDSTGFAALPFFTLSEVPVYEGEYEEIEDDENQYSMFDDYEFEQQERKIIGYRRQKGMVRRQCTNEYKIAVIRRKVRQYLGYEKGQRVKDLVHMWKGISTDEIQRMDVSRDSWIQYRYPLIDANMSRLDCEKWLIKGGVLRSTKIKLHWLPVP